MLGFYVVFPNIYWLTELGNINSRKISAILSTTKRIRNSSVDIPLIANIIGFVVHKEGLTESQTAFS